MCREKCTPDQRISEYPFNEMINSFYVTVTITKMVPCLMYTRVRITSRREILSTTDAKGQVHLKVECSNIKCGFDIELIIA